MSFAGEVKTELCRAPLSRRCCALAEAYGVLLYCNAFQTSQVRVVTECAAFAQRLPQLFKKAFHIAFDRLPEGAGKAVFVLDSPEKLAALSGDVDIAPMNLQNVFVALCGHGDEG